MTKHLLHVGYAKAGSTFLQRWFAARADTAFAVGGIAGFRSVYEMVAAAADGEQAPSWRVTSCEGLAAPQREAGLWAPEPAPLGTDWGHRQSAACALLADLFPDASVLIVTRGFRSMILSSYSQYVRSGGRDDFKALLREGGGGDHPWHYDRLIGTYRRAFGAERVILLPYELLRDAPARFAAALEERLGLPPFPPEDRRWNVSLSPAEMHWYPRFSRWAAKFMRGAGARRRLWPAYVRALDRRRFAPLATLLHRLHPHTPVADTIDDEVLRAFRGCAECLRDEPLHRRYRDEYLL